MLTDICPNDEKNELHFFKLLFDDKLVDEIIQNSEEYFRNKFLKNKKEKFSKNSYSWLYKQHGIEKSNIMKLIAILIYMGLEPKKKVTDYWSTNIFFSNSFVPLVMSRNMFYFLCAALHIELKDNDLNNDFEEELEVEDDMDYEDNNEVQQSQKNFNHKVEDPRKKVLMFIEKICYNFKKYYYPDTDLCIDESLVYFRGRSSLKFYMPMKPHKWGFKFHMICESNSHYVLDILFDAGKEYKDLITLPNHSFTESIIVRLTKYYSHNNHIIYFDSWYSSLSIFTKLKEMGIYATSILKNTYNNIPLSEYYNIYTIEDRKTLNFISNIHSDQIDSNSKNKPNIQYQYIKNAKSIDYINQYSAFHGNKKRSKKWWKKVFMFMLDVIISNSIVLKEKYTHKKVENKQFLENLIKQLVNYDDVETISVRPKIIPEKYLYLLHNIKKMSYKSQKCIECHKSCTYKCQECDKFIHPECFNNYHKKNIYNIN